MVKIPLLCAGCYNRDEHGSEEKSPCSDDKASYRGKLETKDLYKVMVIDKTSF